MDHVFAASPTSVLDARIGYVDCPVYGGITLHPLQEREPGMATVAVLRERRHDCAEWNPGEH